MDAVRAKGLPPLPHPDRTMWQYGQQIDHFTAAQMFAYARDAVDAEREKWVASVRLELDSNGQADAIIAGVKP
jgi:hypothetical protein